MTKEEKLIKLKELGLIEDEKNFKNLTEVQIDYLIERVTVLKRPELNEEEIDKLCKSNLVKDVIQSQLSQEVVKRRKAEQELASLKNSIKNKVEDIISLFKK
jgi:organic radical activating enzyme